MITTVRADITWEGKPAKAIANCSEKSLKDYIRLETGAIDVEIIDSNSWTEEGDDNWDE